MNVTIRDLITFYNEKSDDMSDCSETKKFLREKGCAGAYADLAKCMEFDKGKEDDMAFSKILKKCELSQYLFEDALSIHIMSPYIDDRDRNGDRMISQKWHLLVAVYAYLDAANNKFPQIFENFSCNKKRAIRFDEIVTGTELNWNLIEKGSRSRGYSYDPLKLWMAETAGVENLDAYIYLDKRAGRQVNIPWVKVEAKITEWKRTKGKV